MVAPVIPAVNDIEIEAILKAAAVAGVQEAGYTMLRLPLEVKDIFKEWLRRRCRSGRPKSCGWCGP